MSGHKFDITKLEKLNNLERLKMIDLDFILKELNLNESPSIVDIGVGTGLFAQEMIERISKAKVYGFDVSKEMINWIKENRLESLEGKLEVEVMEENKIPINDKVGDLAMMIMLHHELENPILLLKDANRALKEDGKLLLIDWREEMNKHFSKRDDIIFNLDSAGFTNIKEIEASEKLITFICEK